MPPARHTLLTSSLRAAGAPPDHYTRYMRYLRYIRHTRYRSPAWPVGPREMCGVRVIARRVSDGAIRVALRSVDVPGCRVPSGYTRMALECGGYEATPLGPERTHLKYGAHLPPLDGTPTPTPKARPARRAPLPTRVHAVSMLPSHITPIRACRHRGRAAVNMVDPFPCNNIPL